MISPLVRLCTLLFLLTPSPALLRLPAGTGPSIGPLKGLLFRLANFRPGLGGPKPENAAYDSDGLLPAGARTTRTPDGSVAGGAAGMTFTDFCESCRAPM